MSDHQLGTTPVEPLEVAAPLQAPRSNGATPAGAGTRAGVGALARAASTSRRRRAPTETLPPEPGPSPDVGPASEPARPGVGDSPGAVGASGAVASGAVPSGAAGPPGRRRQLPQLLAATSPAGVYAGVVVALAGFALIAVAWGQVAGQTDVAFQVPYLVSGGLAGIGLILVGLTVINLAAVRRDNSERTRQLDRLADLLAQANQTLAEDTQEGQLPGGSARR